MSGPLGARRPRDDRATRARDFEFDADYGIRPSGSVPHRRVGCAASARRSPRAIGEADVGAGQAAELVGFVIAIAGLLLALDAGLRRDRRR